MIGLINHNSVEEKELPGIDLLVMFVTSLGFESSINNSSFTIAVIIRQEIKDTNTTAAPMF